MASSEETTFKCRVSEYEFSRQLKYGCNPHQKPAAVLSIKGVNGRGKLPFNVLNGNPGYINFCDALNAWQLVLDLKKSLGVAAATSFKHVSPAGAAIAVELSPELVATYGIEPLMAKLKAKGVDSLTPAALAYIRARNGDPKSSFGDFAALSERVDVATATYLATCVSDGIIAPGYDDDALEILKKKKSGNYIILEGDVSYEPPMDEYRELYGVVLYQKRNDVIITKENSCTQIVTANKELPDQAQSDLILAAIATKYTQSNSVCFALNGQVIGVGAGQQSRVDCVKLARMKAEIWRLRQHPKVLALKFKAGVKKTPRTNAGIAYIEGDMTKPEYDCWVQNFEEVPEPLTSEEKAEFLSKTENVALFSDAFFPFRDSIDQASKIGVRYVLQAGGSRQDDQVIAACDDYKMVMCFNGIRVFHH